MGEAVLQSLDLVFLFKVVLLDLVVFFACVERVGESATVTCPLGSCGLLVLTELFVLGDELVDVLITHLLTRTDDGGQPAEIPLRRRCQWRLLLLLVVGLQLRHGWGHRGRLG